MDEQESIKEDGYEDTKKYPPFRIWDMPFEVSDELKKFAKENTGNRIWLAIKLLLDKNKQYLEIEDKMNGLEKRIDQIELVKQKPEENNNEPITFRGRIRGDGNGKV